MVDSTKDHDTNLTQAQVVMLPNDVVDLTMEGLEEIRDLLVMQQVQISILTSGAFQFASCTCTMGTSFPLFSFYKASRDPWPSQTV